MNNIESLIDEIIRTAFCEASSVFCKKQMPFFRISNLYPAMQHTYGNKLTWAGPLNTHERSQICLESYIRGKCSPLLLD